MRTPDPTASARRLVTGHTATPEQRAAALGIIAEHRGPINTPRSDAALSTIAGHHALHARHILAEAGRHREAPMAVDVPDDPPPLVVFRPVDTGPLRKWLLVAIAICTGIGVLQLAALIALRMGWL